MAMNQIQFQRGLSLKQFLSRYGTEEQCFEALARARWPDGFVCPHCGETIASQFQRGWQRLWQCRSCRTQTSLTAGTLWRTPNCRFSTGGWRCTSSATPKTASPPSS